MAKEITKVNMETLTPVTEHSVETFITQAINKKAPIETMERLFVLQEKVNAARAKQAFDNAMAEFQGECPVIKKTKDGGSTKGENAKVAYKYAPLDQIISQTKELISKHGFSYIIKLEVTTQRVKAICIVKHSMGHSETSEMDVPMTAGTGIMSAPQVVASTSTFAKRYAFCNAFGIMTGDEDNDANEPQEVKKPENELELDEPSIKQIQSAQTIEKLNALCKGIQVAKGPKYRKSIVAHYMTRKNEIESSQIVSEVEAGLAEKEQA